MKKEINAKITSTKKFVTTHKTKIALATGIAIGAAAALTVHHHINKDKVMLELPPEQALRMRTEGGAVIYDTPYGAVMANMPDNIQQTPE